MGRITSSRTQLRPDPKYNSLLASKFINCLMLDGKKAVAQAVFYAALDEIGKRVSEKEPIEVFHQAVENIKPQIEVRSRRVGGAAYQVPMQVNRNRQQSLALRWLLMAVREKKGRPTQLKLAEELLAAYNREGAAMTRRENVHRMADANKAFAHFAW
jgi:small subunit ribosomal protein S7